MTAPEKNLKLTLQIAGSGLKFGGWLCGVAIQSLLFFWRLGETDKQFQRRITREDTKRWKGREKISGTIVNVNDTSDNNLPLRLNHIPRPADGFCK